MGSFSLAYCAVREFSSINVEINVFVYYFTNVNQSCEAVGERIATLDLLAWADEAYRTAEDLWARLTGDEPSASIVALSVAAPVQKSVHFVMSIRWEATGDGGLFKDLPADLIVAPIGPNKCQISLRGSYKQPPGVDKALFHRITEACVKSFVDRLVVGLEHLQVAEFAG